MALVGQGGVGLWDQPDRFVRSQQGRSHEELGRGRHSGPGGTTEAFQPEPPTVAVLRPHPGEGEQVRLRQGGYRANPGHLELQPEERGSAELRRAAAAGGLVGDGPSDRAANPGVTGSFPRPRERSRRAMPEEASRDPSPPARRGRGSSGEGFETGAKDFDRPLYHRVDIFYATALAPLRHGGHQRAAQSIAGHRGQQVDIGILRMSCSYELTDDGRERRLNDPQVNGNTISADNTGTQQRRLVD